MADFRSQQDLYPGIRNNNPGNLRPSGDKWQGMVGDKGGFLIFMNVAFGVRAMAININTLMIRGNNTVEKLIHTYAPPFENHTRAYVLAVANAMGVNPQAPLKMDRIAWFRMVKAMIKVENGNQAFHITDADINAGLDLAAVRLGLKKK